MKKLGIGYFADGPWAHEAFKLLVADETLKIEFIVLRYSIKDPVLQKYAADYNIDCFVHKDINSDEFYGIVNKYNCDLFVSMSFNQIFKKRILNLPALKTINCHAGKLPFYRGRNILNWVLINDEKEFGITVHFVDDGIDTGDIILQKTFPITDDDDYSTILDTAYIGCANTLYESIKNFQNGEVSTIKQIDIHPVGFYCGRRILGDEVIDWNQSSRDIFNFVRAICNPGPMAITFLNGKEVHINKVRVINEAPVYKCVVGQIIGKVNNSIYVKTKDSFIEVTEYYYDGKIKIGDRFKNI